MEHSLFPDEDVSVCVDEDLNKAYFLCLQSWIDNTKEDNFSLFLPSEGSEDSLLSSYVKHEEDLCKYLQTVNVWLRSKEMHEVLKELPTAGKLLSNMCKLSLLHLNDTLLDNIIDCLMNLSKITKSIEQNDTNITSRAQIWTVDHLSNLSCLPVDGMYLVLVEEFGVLGKEYLLEHLSQTISNIAEIIITTYKTENLAFNAVIKEAFEIIPMLSVDVTEPILRSLLLCTQQNTAIKSRLLSYLKNVSMNDLQNCTSATLDLVFTFEYTIFEDYAVCVIEKFYLLYPTVDENSFAQNLSFKGIFELIDCNVKYLFGFLDVIKRSCLHIGFDPFLIYLVTALKKLYQNMVLKQSEFVEDYTSFFNSYTTRLTSKCEENERKRDTEAWWFLICNKKMIDTSLLCLLDESKQDVDARVSILFGFLYQTKMKEVHRVKPELISYVKALRSLLQKKHIELSDVIYLHEQVSTKTSINLNEFFVLTIVLFCMTSSVACSRTEEILSYISNKMDSKVFVFWLYYGIEVIFKSTLKISLEARVGLSNAVSNLERKGFNKMISDNLKRLLNE